MKDGVYLTKLASEIWNNTSDENREVYKELARELKELQISFHKDKTYCKSKPAGSIFVNMNDDSFVKKTNPTGKRIKKNPRKSRKKQAIKKENDFQPQQIIQKDQNIQQILYSFDLPQPQLMDTPPIEPPFEIFGIPINLDSYNYNPSYPSLSFDSFDPYILPLDEDVEYFYS